MQAFSTRHGLNWFFWVPVITFGVSWNSQDIFIHFTNCGNNNNNNNKCRLFFLIFLWDYGHMISWVKENLKYKWLSGPNSWAVWNAWVKGMPCQPVRWTMGLTKNSLLLWWKRKPFSFIQFLLLDLGKVATIQ